MKSNNKILIIGVIVLFVGAAAFFLLRKPAAPQPNPDNKDDKDDNSEDTDNKDGNEDDDKPDDYLYVPSITTPTGFYTGL